MKYFLLVLRFSILASLIACSSKVATDEVSVEDQGRFSGSEETTTPDPPDADDVDTSQSLVFLNSATLYVNQTTSVKFTAHDSTGNSIPVTGLTVTFSLVGSGTSDVSFSAVTDAGNGVYTATVTGLTPGSRDFIKATVDGDDVDDQEAITVGAGPYYRDMTLSSATDQDEYQVQVDLTTSNFDYTNVDPEGDDLRFYDDNFNELSFYTEHWDTSGDSKIWVKVLNTGTSTIRMYYGDTSLANASSVENTFSYSVSKSVWMELSSDNNSNSMNIASYVASNTVTPAGATGAQSVSPNTPTTYASVDQGLISASAPISGRYATITNGADSLSSLAFTATTFGYPISRANDDKWDFYNPGSTDANVTIRSFDTSGTELTTTNLVVSANSFGAATFQVDNFGLVESDQPLVGFYHEDGNDGVLLMPPSTEIIGPFADDLGVGIMEDNTVGTIYYSDGTSRVFTGDKGDSLDLSGGGSGADGMAARIVANKNVVASSQADGDGSESASFWPVTELDRDYIIPSNAEFFQVYCLETVNIEVQDETGTIIDTDICTPAFDYPGRVSKTAGYNAGTRVIGDANFYIYYEHLNEDETNVLSWKQGRAYSPTIPRITVGSEQNL